MEYRLNAPPYWPQPPPDWTPVPGWRPDPSWGEAPVGWPLWVPAADADLPDPSSTKRKSHPLLLLLAVVLCCTFAFIVFGTLKALGANDLVSNAGFTLVGAVKAVRNWLAKAAERRGILQPDPIPGFRQGWGLRFVYGTLSYFAALQAGGFVAGLISGALGVDFMAAAASTGILTSIVVFVVVGFSAGSRVGGGLAYLVVPAVSLAGQLLGFAATALFLRGNSPDVVEMRTMYLQPGALTYALVVYLARIFRQPVVDHGCGGGAAALV